TGVVVRETVPDSFLTQADQVVNLDLAVEDLQERLRAGKIYAPEKIPWALENFFKDQNLATLRELALREVAESLDRAGLAKGAPEVKASGRVMVCLASNPPRAKTLLSRGSRMAGRLNTDWFVVYVETPQEAPHLIDSEAQRHLLQNIEKAKELGAEVVRLKSTEPAQSILDFARTHGEALEPIDSAAAVLGLGRPDLSDAQAAANFKRFQEELRVQEENITEPGEGEATHALRGEWARYQEAWRTYRELLDPAALRERYF